MKLYEKKFTYLLSGLLGIGLAFGVYCGLSKYIEKKNSDRLYYSHPCSREVEEYKKLLESMGMPEIEELRLLECECRRLAKEEAEGKAALERLERVLESIENVNRKLEESIENVNQEVERLLEELENR
ncbi:MAG: hypothetical protein QXM64_00060 [Candidatus Aenigmatarchaeota archaeon]